MLDKITPLILTLNEEANIERTLSHLSWAREIVVLDSFSTDRTVELAKRDPRVRLVQRAFDSHAGQWNFGLRQTKISTPWVLALDADYQVTSDVERELAEMQDEPEVMAYWARFRYAVHGKVLRGAAYPPVAVLFRWDQAQYTQDGHTQRLQFRGKCRMLRNTLVHDDRKPLRHWLASQQRYVKLEAKKLSTAHPSELSLADRIRRLILPAPPLVFLLCYLIKGGFLDGRAGLHYALQRALAELLLSLELIDERIRRS
jgi:glycosyltransferase involved in cell wall biosynthesis